MNQNVNQGDSEVVYLIPCKEKHIGSQIIYAGKSQVDLIKIYLSNVRSSALPVVTSGNSNITKKFNGKAHCSLVKNKWNNHLKKNKFGCVLNAKSQTLHPTFATPVSTDSLSRSNTYDAGYQVNVADGKLYDSSSVIQSASVVTGENLQNDALNVDEFCNLLRDISEQGISSEGRDHFPLGDKEMSCKVPLPTSQNLEGSLETVLTNDGHITSLQDGGICCAVIDNKVNNQSFVPLSSETLCTNNSYLDTSLGQAATCSSVSCGQPYVKHQLLSNELVWTQQAPRPTVMPITSSNMMWNCNQESIVDELLGSFQDIQCTSNGEQTTSCDYPQQKVTMYDQSASSEVIDVNRITEGVQENKLGTADMIFDIPKLQNVFPESDMSEVAETSDKGNIFQSTLNCSRLDDLKFPESSKEPSKSSEVSNISDIISDVADILDEIHTNETQLPVPEGNFLLDCAKSVSPVLDQISSCSSGISGKAQLDDFITSLDGTTDFSLDTLFQTPQGNQKTDENNNSKSTRGHPSSDAENVYFDDSMEKSESALIFSELITSQEEYENSPEKCAITSDKSCGNSSGHEITKVTESSLSLQTKIIQPNSSSADSPGIPKRVAFKVRPAGKPVRNADKGRITEKVSRIPKLMRPTLGKDRSTKLDLRPPKSAEAFTEQLKGNSSDKNFFSPRYVSCKYFATYDEPRVEGTPSVIDSNEQKQDNLILPIGTTGMSIAIPNTVKTDMVSFIPAGEKICEPSKTNLIPANTSCSQLHASSDFLSGLSSKKPVIQYIKPNFQNTNYIVGSSSNTKSVGTLNQVIQQTILETSDVLLPVSSPAVTFSSAGQVIDPYSQNSNCKPIYVVLPSTTNTLNNGIAHYSLPITSIMSQAGKSKTNSISTLQIVQIDGRDTILKQSLIKPAWPIAPADSRVNANVCKKTLENQTSDKISEPIRITVRTRSKILAPNQGGYGSYTKCSLGSQDRIKMKCTPSSIPKAVKNRNLVKELKIHFPTVPEAILQQLTIPPQAVNRGYLTRHDLQNLHTQALKLHLSIVYRNHVTKCTNYNCETCRNFVGQQDSLKWSLKEQQNKSKNGCRNNKSKKGQVKPRKSVKKCIRSRNMNGEDDDPTYEPPISYFKAWKRKIDSNWCSRQPMKILKVEGHTADENTLNTKENSILLKSEQLKGNASEQWKTALKRSLSEPAITKVVGQNTEETIKHSQDDMDLKFCKNPSKIQYTVSLPTVDANGSGFFMENVCENSSGNVYQMPAVSSDNHIYQPKSLEEKKDFDMDCKLQQWPSIYNDQNYTFSCGMNPNLNATNLPSSVISYPYTTKSTESQCYCLDTNMAVMTPQPVPLNSECQYSPALYLEKGCNCSESCRTMKCPCARAGVLCRVDQACSCKNCDNPLNILHQYELDVLLARVDECLMQNLYSYEISGLCNLLVSDVVMPCCTTTSKLQHIIPGTVICNCCGNAVTYSWCTHSVHLQTVCPRNHCMVCCACKPTLHTHCQSLLGGPPCSIPLQLHHFSLRSSSCD
ncbi:uncharacterized protein [Macrobrachium rosenbergii]|uniref:uncharacterized protein isoform X3 n=1 Tax=Macrobrachium rosenbergii TaxID=79674 RepID=UPI0034D40B3E